VDNVDGAAGGSTGGVADAADDEIRLPITTQIAAREHRSPKLVIGRLSKEHDAARLNTELARTEGAVQYIDCTGIVPAHVREGGINQQVHLAILIEISGRKDGGSSLVSGTFSGDLEGGASCGQASVHPTAIRTAITVIVNAVIADLFGIGVDCSIVIIAVQAT
jgi:hypothetical protein